LEKELRENQLPSTIFKENPSLLKFKPANKPMPGSNTDRKKKQVYANEEDKLLDKMT
jgi:hypothetical protein